MNTDDDVIDHDFQSEVTMIHDPDELLTLVELERMRHTKRVSQPGTPSEEAW